MLMNGLLTPSIIAKEILRVSGADFTEGTSIMEVDATDLSMSLDNFDAQLLAALQRLGPLEVDWPLGVTTSRQQLQDRVAQVSLNGSQMKISRWHI